MAWEVRGKPADVMYHSEQAMHYKIRKSDGYCGVIVKKRHKLTWELLGLQPNGTICSQPEIRMGTELWIR